MISRALFASLLVAGAAAGPVAAAENPPSLLEAGEFVKIYDPSVGEHEKWYINDHCFIRGQDGTWHLFGITHAEPSDALDEDNFAHARARTLTQQPWEKLPFALSVAPKAPWREEHLWAPHVVFHDGVYYMFYCAGAKDHTKYKIHLATSPDLETWTRHPKNPMVVDGFDARDPFVTRIGDEWVMYYTATSAPSGGHHVVKYATSPDLTSWKIRGTVFTDPSQGKYGGPTESPFVVHRGDRWYLFIGPRDGDRDVFDGTDVFASTDPFHFRVEDRVGHIAAHAAEVVQDVDGRWYVSRCGAQRGGVYLAPLTWKDGPAASAPAPPAGFSEQVDRAVEEILASSGAPSASVAIIEDGKITHARAYGRARLEPAAAATPEMRYAIGSVSKQFTASAILMLAEEGKLSLDDPVARFLPELTRAREVKIRQLLSHTSGYQDYWPQDYVPLFMQKPATAAEILSRWAKRPLDFEPGTQYQYSNTGYVAAGRIVEKASGMPLLKFLATRIFVPLKMESVWDVDQSGLKDPDPVGYMRYALGPPRVAPKEAPGWLFAAGELAMTAQDLGRWNTAMLEGKLLRSASWRQMQREVLLANGLGTGYGLGLSIGSEAGHRMLSHGGEVSGFTASNSVFPDDHVAVTVLMNLDASDATSDLAKRVANLVFAKKEGSTSAEARARSVFEGLQRGTLDRSLFSEDGNAYFDETAVRDFADSLAPLGAPTAVKQTNRRERGGMTYRNFEVEFPNKTLQIWERDLPDGRIEQFQVMPKATP